MAEEECGTALADEMAAEPYFVDFLRDAPETTGLCWNRVSCCYCIVYCYNINGFFQQLTKQGVIQHPVSFEGKQPKYRTNLIAPEILSL